MTLNRNQQHKADIVQQRSMDNIQRRPVGRPRIDPTTKLTEHVITYFTSTDMVALKNLAITRGISLAHLVRDAALKELERPDGRVVQRQNSGRR